MDVYKLTVEEWAERPLDKERFESETVKRYPYYVVNDKGSPSYFAVCPGCDNPIQIIGFYRRSRHTPKPYAKHVTHSIPTLANYRQESYDYCPYSAPRQFQPGDRRSTEDPLGEKILSILVPNFDRVIYILENDIGIKISYKLAEEMLLDYRGQSGHLYRGATLQNIPWVFAYMTLSKTLLGRRVTGDDDLLEAIEKNVPGVFVHRPSKQVKWQKRGDFLILNYCFIHHRSRKEDGKLIETMKMVVSQGRRNTTVYSKVIEFDRRRFAALLRTPDESAVRPRQEELVGLAERTLGGRG